MQRGIPEVMTSHSKFYINMHEFVIIIFSCFLSHIGALMGAFLAPILVVIIFNAVVFVWVCVVLIRHVRGVATQKKDPVGSKTILRMIISISGVLFFFGLSWLFFILAFLSGLRETFQILFTVFNSLQGFFIFAFIVFTEGFNYWKVLFSCKRRQFWGSSWNKYFFN